MPDVLFQHPQIAGSLQVDTGFDQISWGYNLNTANFPTYKGEVVQILGVYIDDLQIQGTVRTYAEAEAIYKFFIAYMAIAGQGMTGGAQAGTSAYNQEPMIMTYPERNWTFKIQPLTAAQFQYSYDMTAPEWQIQAHVVDDSPNFSDLQQSIVTKLLNGADNQNLQLSGNISPEYGNPDANPFETYQGTEAAAQTQIGKYADYYNSLIPSYMGGDFSSLYTDIGSAPAFGQWGNVPGSQNVAIPKPGTKPKKGG